MKVLVVGLWLLLVVVVGCCWLLLVVVGCCWLWGERDRASVSNLANTARYFQTDPEKKPNGW
jgi:uncharacterized iron-regulated membrane protein